MLSATCLVYLREWEAWDLGLLNPVVEAETIHTSACKVTKPLVDSLLGRTECQMAEVFSGQNTASIESRRAKACLMKNLQRLLKIACITRCSVPFWLPKRRCVQLADSLTAGGFRILTFQE